MSTQQSTAQRGRCNCLCKCIGCTYRSIRFCCCCLGCCCFYFWVVLIWALISLSVSLSDVDWSATEDTCYHKLHVTPESTPKEVQKAFRKLALKYHPDKVSKEQQPEAEKKFQEISHCYDILNNEKTRKQYDAAGYRETNQFGIPFDDEINLQDIFQFFTQNFDFKFNEQTDNDFNTKKEKTHKEYRRNKRTKNKQKSKQYKRKKKNKQLKDHKIYLKLEDIIQDKQHTINIGDNIYNIMIKGGVPNGYMMEDELNGYVWNIKVKPWNENKIWQRRSDNDCHLYSNVTITINHVLMGLNVDIIMIDGTKKTFNMAKYDYMAPLEIKYGGLMEFQSKRKYPKKCAAFVNLDILYPKLDEKQKEKLETFFKSNGKWSYDDMNHNEL